MEPPSITHEQHGQWLVCLQCASCALQHRSCLATTAADAGHATPPDRNAGESVPGSALSHGLDASAFLRGRVDLRCVAAMGHRYRSGVGLRADAAASHPAAAQLAIVAGMP